MEGGWWLGLELDDSSSPDFPAACGCRNPWDRKRRPATRSTCRVELSIPLEPPEDAQSEADATLVMYSNLEGPVGRGEEGGRSAMPSRPFLKPGWTRRRGRKPHADLGVVGFGLCSFGRIVSSEEFTATLNTKKKINALFVNINPCAV